MAHEELPPINITPGAIRFNTDSMKLEYFRIGMEADDSGSYAGVGTMAAGEWVNITTDSPEQNTGGTRGVFIEGQIPGNSNAPGIDFVNIATTGNSQDFGSLVLTGGGGNQPMSDRSRVVFSGNYPANAEIEFVTIASKGSATDFGANLNRTAYLGMGISNATRGVQAGSYSAPNYVAMDYLTIQSTGRVGDFGDLVTGRSHGASVMSSTRGIFAGGYRAPSPSLTNNIISYITTSTLGNISDFGDLSVPARNNGGLCNATRGVISLGRSSSSSGYYNTIEYVTISTLGNTTDFGDTANLATHQSGGCSSSTRGVLTGGYIAPNYKNYMEYIQIMTTGNTTDFGNLATNGINTVGASNGHGGLG